MKRAFIFSLMLQALIVAAAENEWPGVKFAEVRAYAWPVKEGHRQEHVILDGMKLEDGVVNPNGAKLSEDQVKKLLAAVTADHPSHPSAGCYEPHNAFMFYDSDSKPVAFLEICFDCLGKRSESKGLARYLDFAAVAKLFEELKLPIGSYASSDAFTKEFESLKNLGKTGKKN